MGLFGWLRRRGDAAPRKRTAASGDDDFSPVNWSPPGDVDATRAEASPTEVGHHDVPQVDAPQVDVPQIDVPQVDAPDMPDFDTSGGDW